MTAPTQPVQDHETPQPPQDHSTAETVAVIAGLLAAAGSVGATYAAAETARAGIVHALGKLGLRRRDAQRLVAQDATTPPAPAIPLSEVARRAYAGGPTYRALYLVNAAKRLGKAAKSPDTTVLDQAHRERRYFAQHKTAQQERQQAAQRLDAALNSYGPILGWYARLDERTTPECRAANRRNFNPNRPPAIGLPGLKHSGRCVPAGTVVASPRPLAATSRWYTGELVEITTADGHDLAITPNHPVLTPQGWVAAGLLNEGDELISTPFAEALARLVDPDHHQEPTAIEKVAGTLLDHGGVVTPAMPVAAEDFHGDGFGGQVDVVWADGVLRDRLNTAGSEPSRVEQLKRVAGRDSVQGGSPQTLSLEAELSLSGESDPLRALRDTASGGMCSLCVAGVLLGRAPRHHHAVGLGEAAQPNAVGAENTLNLTARHPGSFGDAVDAVPAEIGADHSIDRQRGPSGGAGVLSTSHCEPVGVRLTAERPALNEPGVQLAASDVELVGDGRDAAVAALVRRDRVVKVVVRPSWSGHVYNLETSKGWYAAASVIVHNCRCWPGPPIPGGNRVDDLGPAHEHTNSRGGIELSGWNAAAHPRAKAGSPQGGQFVPLGQARDNQAAQAQKVKTAVADYKATLTAKDAKAQKAQLKGMDDTRLEALSRVLYSYNTSDPHVVAARIAVANELARRGLDVKDYGALGGGLTPAQKAAAAAKRAAKPAAKKTAGKKTKAIAPSPFVHLAADTAAVELSAKTAYYSGHHHELGTPGGPGLWRHKGWQLPDYITNIAKGIIESGQVDKSRAISIAVGKVRDWAEGKGKVSPEVRAASAKAIAEWEALRAASRAGKK